ncbi:MAG: nitroreductase family protein [Syntrophobacterales bacterium]|jgi:nitroreductase|nr:nitroreductase family protein [Syntrophobacterales bacterium]
MELLKAIRERRSVRKYRTDPVPDEIIIEILDAARNAPSWANTQVPRFIVVKNRCVMEALGETLPPTNPAKKAVTNAPCVICIIAKKGLSGYHKGVPATYKGDWLMFDAGIAMEHIVLAAWGFGLGTVHVGMFDAKAAKKILKVPEEFAVVELTPVGYFDEIPRTTPKRPLKESVSLDTYGFPYIG